MIEIRNAPTIPGLNFRLFLGDSDFPQMAAVLTASETADQRERNVSAEDIANAFHHLSNCDPYRDLIVAEVMGAIVGYTRGWSESDSIAGQIYHHNGFLLPEWRRKGIGRSMLFWMENHFRDLAASPSPEVPRCFQVNVTQFQDGTAHMLESAGYQPKRQFFEMVRSSLDDILDFPLPDGLEIRPVNPDQYPAIWKSSEETSEEEWGHKEPSAEDYQEWLAGPHFQPHLWQVAWDLETNQIAGHVLTFIHEDENKQFNRKRGYTEGIGVVRSWRRRGVARALISRSLQAQKAAGMKESALVADGDSTSNVIPLYESCGFQITKRDTIYRKPF